MPGLAYSKDEVILLGGDSFSPSLCPFLSSWGKEKSPISLSQLPPFLEAYGSLVVTLRKPVHSLPIHFLFLRYLKGPDHSLADLPEATVRPTPTGLFMLGSDSMTGN